MNGWEAAAFLEENQLEAAVGKRSPERDAYLEELWPGWRDVDVEVIRNAAWLEDLDVGYDSREQSPGRWFQEQQDRARAGLLPAVQRARLDEAMPGWLFA